MIKTIVFNSTVVDSLLSYARIQHPKEGILLLRGKVDKEKIVVSDTQIPPFATHGHSFSSFPLYMLPIDFSIVGVHSFSSIRRIKTIYDGFEQVLWKNHGHNHLSISDTKRHSSV